MADILAGIQEVENRITEKFLDNLTENLRTELSSLITEDGAWNGFVDAAELSREEGAALRDALKERLAWKPSGENDGPDRKQQIERFLREFPQLKKKLEDHIRKLRELADTLDKVHKDCTISNVVSTSVSVASGALGLLGLILAPFTLGASLAISASSVALGATSSVSGLTTTAVEESLRQKYESEARYLVGASIQVLDEILKILPNITYKFFGTIAELVEAFKTLKDQIRAIRTVRSISRHGAEARDLTHAVQGVLPMTRRARIRAGGITSLFLVWDVCDLVSESKDLHDGAKTESAGALRELAHKLEENLQKFEQKYKDLR